MCILIFPAQHVHCNSSLRTLVFFPFWNILNVIPSILFFGNSFYMHVGSFYSLSISLKVSFISCSSGILSCILDKFLTALFKFTAFLFATSLEFILSLEIFISITTFFYCKISNSFFLYPSIYFFIST